jgi:hypothetical protein
LPQVAATLAAALVAYDTRNAAGQRLLDTTMLNAVLVLMLVTSLLGPLLVERFAPKMQGVISPAVRSRPVAAQARDKLFWPRCRTGSRAGPIGGDAVGPYGGRLGGLI